MISDDDMKKALDAIARTHDGELLYRYLQKQLCAVASDAAVREGALPGLEGRRRFAAELMAHMAEGIRESGRADTTVTFAVSGPRAIGRAAGIGRIRAALAAESDAESGSDTGTGG